MDRIKGGGREENKDTDKTGYKRNVLKIIVRYEKIIILGTGR